MTGSQDVVTRDPHSPPTGALPTQWEPFQPSNKGAISKVSRQSQTPFSTDFPRCLYVHGRILLPVIFCTSKERLQFLSNIAILLVESGCMHNSVVKWAFINRPGIFYSRFVWIRCSFTLIHTNLESNIPGLFINHEPCLHRLVYSSHPWYFLVLPQRCRVVPVVEWRRCRPLIFCVVVGAPIAVWGGVAQVELEVARRPQYFLRRRRNGNIMPLRRRKGIFWILIHSAFNDSWQCSLDPSFVEGNFALWDLKDKN